MQVNKIDAIILAGGKTEDALREITNVENKALIPIYEKLMIEYAISAISSSKYIDKIIVIGDVEKLKFLESGYIKLVPSTNSMLKNVIEGIKQTTSDKVLIASCDIPLITSEMIDIFIEQCQDPTVDGYYPIIKKDTILSKYPGVKRTYAKVKEGTFTGGNIGIVNPQIFTEHHNIYENLIASRKSPLKLVKILGIIFLIKFILGRLTIRDAENKLGKILGNIKLKAIFTVYPEIGIDVDKVSDLKLVEGVLKK